MSKIIKTSGIIISENITLQQDKILTVLTPNLGKISVIVKKCYTKNKQYISGTEFLAFSDFILFKGEKMYHLNELHLKENFYNIRMDFDKLVTASEILKFVRKYIDEAISIHTNISKIEYIEYYNIFKLTIISLYNISMESRPLKQIELIYKFKVLDILGFKIQLPMILKEEKSSEVFMPKEKTYINRYIYNILKYIQKTELEKCMNFKTTENKLEELEEYLQKFIQFNF